MKNKKLNLILMILLIFFVTACDFNDIGSLINNNMKVFNVPYLGDIPVGNVTFNMLSTIQHLEEKGMKQGYVDIFTYEDEDTNSKIFYQHDGDIDNFYITFVTHNSLYRDLGVLNVVLQ